MPCTIKINTNSEYINKQQVMSDYADWYGYDYQNNWFYKHLKNMSSVNIPNKVGHWEYNQYDGNPNIGNWHCSECRNIVSDMPTCMGKPLYKFCPHCGCPMEIER